MFNLTTLIISEVRSIWSLGDEWHTTRSVDWMLVCVGGSRIVLRMTDYSVSTDLFRDESCVKKHTLNKPTDELVHRPTLDLVATRSHSDS